MFVKIAVVCMVAIFIGSADALKSRAVQNFMSESNLNDQIKMEMEAAQIYLSMSSHFAHDAIALHGFSKFFKDSWKEELSHAEELISYVTLRGGNVQTPAVPKPANDTKWSEMTPCEIVNIALGLEMGVNTNLLKVHKDADSDPHLQDFLESKFLDEQVEANKELADLLTKMERATQYIKSDGQKAYSCDGLGLHTIDKELQ